MRTAATTRSRRTKVAQPARRRQNPAAPPDRHDCRADPSAIPTSVSRSALAEAACPLAAISIAHTRPAWRARLDTRLICAVSTRGGSVETRSRSGPCKSATQTLVLRPWCTCERCVTLARSGRALREQPVLLTMASARDAGGRHGAQDRRGPREALIDSLGTETMGDRQHGAEFGHLDDGDKFTSTPTARHRPAVAFDNPSRHPAPNGTAQRRSRQRLAP